jgi:hypothetical protein
MFRALWFFGRAPGVDQAFQQPLFEGEGALSRFTKAQSCLATRTAIFTEREPFIKRLIARIVGFDGAYHRFTGKVTIEKFDKDVRVEIFDDHALWELIYLGKARSPTL